MNLPHDLPQNRRILLVDDMPAIHEVFRKILLPELAERAELCTMESALFGDDISTAAEMRPTRFGSDAESPSPASANAISFELDSAHQGQEGLAKLRAALAAGRPYALAFVDMRMPPGWNGVETIGRLWQADPRLQVVICTAHSDNSWDEVLATLDGRDRLLILKKPFDAIEVFQLACTLTAKWQATQQVELKMAHLEDAVERRTGELRAANEAMQRDIARRIRTEAELKVTSSLFHNTLNGVMVLDLARHIVSVNPAFSGLTGYTAAQVVGRPASLLRCDRHPAAFYDDMWTVVEHEGRWRGEVWNARHDGEAFVSSQQIVMVAGSDGRPERYVSVFNDITELRRQQDQIRQMALHDSLTGLANRILLDDRLEHAIASARRENAPLALMFIDLDRFKAINDSFGHHYGNCLLMEVANRLTTGLRKSDTVARMGGDEFVVLIRQVETPPNLGLVAQKLIASLSMPVSVGDQVMQVGASIGIACFPDDGQDAVELMKHADAAMYAAKAAGRGTYRFFQPAMTAQAAQRLQTEMELRSAVPNGELELFYQPKVSLVTGAPCGVEALVRWRHPVRGLLAPGDFIGIAEATGIIGDLGDWVLEEACRQSRAWQSQGLGRVKIAVNVSARQLQQRNLVERIDSLTQQYQISASDLEIELTESVLMANPQEMSDVLARLRDLGVLVAVDDFGTGYSSLAYLRRLPIDVLKIDRSFVMNADRDEGDAQVVRLILSFGLALKLAIVAEGVETLAQAEFLQSCGCITAQGYLFSRPLPAKEIEVWLRERADRLVHCVSEMAAPTGPKGERLEGAHSSLQSLDGAPATSAASRLDCAPSRRSRGCHFTDAVD